MNYPNFISGKSLCSYCGNILEDECFTVRENFLVTNYFDYEDGSDNMFCSKECLCDSLFVDTVEEVVGWNTL